MSLKKYREKRNFSNSPEPKGISKNRREGKTKPALLYVVQKHRASRLHYDFRLEYQGRLLSWAVPKGPSLDPSVKRLAMQVGDHPIEYAKFEGVIPKGEYGGGTVMVWEGTWKPEQSDVKGRLALAWRRVRRRHRVSPRWPEREQRVIELHHVCPVGLTRATAMNATRLQCGFQLIASNRAESAGAPKKCFGFTDHLPFPQGRILLGKRNVLPFALRRARRRASA